MPVISLSELWPSHSSMADGTRDGEDEARERGPGATPLNTKGRRPTRRYPERAPAGRPAHSPKRRASSRSADDASWRGWRGLAGSGRGMSRAVLSRRMNRFNFGSETPNRAAITAGGRRASQHSCKSASSAAEGVHCLKVRGIALDPDLEARRQPCAGFCHANKGRAPVTPVLAWRVEPLSKICEGAPRP
jgi:hypothetical protein